MPVARGVKVGVIGTVFVGMVGVAGFGAYNIYSSLSDSGGDASGGTTVAATVDTSPLTTEDVAGTAQAFLTAWSAGDAAKAGGLTDSPQTAAAALTAFRTGARVGSLTAVPGSSAPGSAAVPFHVTSQVSYGGVTRPWSYDSRLTVVRDAAGHPAVKWEPSVMEPELTGGDTVVTGPSATPDLEFLDRDGKVMTQAAFPSLAGIFGWMRTHDADKLTGGTPSVETYVRKADGSAGTAFLTLVRGQGRKLRTTLDSGVQAAAEKAVAGKSQAGVTALDTDDGTILAIANSPAGGFDYAMNSGLAPGSTFKIVTSAGLLENGMSRDSTAPCVNGANYDHGRAYHNDSGVRDNPGATLDWDFAVSCNTGFISQADHLADGGLQTAARQFGLTQTWNVGTPCTDPAVPASTGDALTSEMIGQGSLKMSPLIMASVAATVRDGAFHQPRIVAKSLLGGPVATAPALPSSVSSQLRKMMHGVIAYGTGVGVMTGSDAGAKTGSAEVDGQTAANGWFTAYSGHVAAAAVAEDAGHGNSSAGPIVAAVLRAS